jgi:hypothetical protein
MTPERRNFITAMALAYMHSNLDDVNAAFEDDSPAGAVSVGGRADAPVTGAEMDELLRERARADSDWPAELRDALGDAERLLKREDGP